jgi:hypothetical protein
MGARVMAIALVASALWYLWLGARPDRSLGAGALRVFGVTLAGAFFGKLLGIALHWLSRTAKRRRAARLQHEILEH